MKTLTMQVFILYLIFGGIVDSQTLVVARSSYMLFNPNPAGYDGAYRPQIHFSPPQVCERISSYT